MEVQVVRTLEEFESLREEWNLLADQQQHPLLRHEWFECCARAFPSYGDLRVITLRHSQRLVGAAPLTLRTAHGVSRLELLGMAALFEPSGLLFADEQALSVLVKALVDMKVPLLLQRLAHNSIVPSLLRQARHWPSVLVQRPTAGCLSVPMTTSWADYYKSLSSRITVNLRRVKVKSNALGGTTVSVKTVTEQEVGGLLEQIVRIEGSGWKGRRGSALASNRQLRTFFELYSTRAAREGVLRVATLRFGDDVAATEMATVAYRRWWQLKIGYDERFAKYYPGLQLTEATIRYAFEQALESYEFLGSPGSWETNWRPEARKESTTAWYPATGSGVGALLLDASAVLGRQISRLAAKRDNHQTQ